MAEGKKKVFVGMSGGVDSSVSAALLKEEGYDVTGVFIKVWQPDFLACSQIDDRRESMRAAAHLGIPWRELDLEDVYKREVVDYMIAEYAAGRTPNPDVMCNRAVKFGAFLDWARAEGADFIATGHYARVEEKDGEYRLLAGVDLDKDQSYFLWTLTQDQLRSVLFPVGGFIKRSEVRALAKKFALPNAERKDSQGLCFIGKVDMKEFLKRYIPEKEGDVLDEAGNVIGSHDGALYLALGQRHGFLVTKKKPDDPPRYVIAKDLEKNTITVSFREVQDEIAGARCLALENTNFIAGTEPDLGRTYTSRIRYRQELQGCVIKKEGESYSIEFADLQRAAAPGQSVVFYDRDTCLGGGVIKEVFREE